MEFEWYAEKILCFERFPAKIRDINFNMTGSMNMFHCLFCLTSEHISISSDVHFRRLVCLQRVFNTSRVKRD